MKEAQLSYCGQQVRTYDADRFLLSMFAPSDCHEALWALFAFNHEIAKTREVVTETQLGLIRLQWWRDAIAAIYGDETERGVPAHGVVQPLAEAIARYDLPRAHFDALIYAREFDLEDVLPGNLEGTLNYADFTATPLMKLAVQICGGDPEAEPAQPIAVNYALVGLLRAVRAHALQRRCYLPEDLLKRHGVFTNQLYELKPQQGLAEVVEILADEFVADIKSDVPFLRASQALSHIYIKQIRRLRHDVLSPRLILPPAFKALRLYAALKLMRV